LSDPRVRLWFHNGVTTMNYCHRPDVPLDLPNGPTARRPLRVLVVDDHRDAADRLALLLHLTGHQVAVVYGGPEALVTAPAFRPAVVFLDLGIPKLDGFGVAAWLRQQATLQDVLLVAVTGFGGEEDRRRAAEVGFDHFFAKPVNFGDLDRIMVGATQKRSSAF
jgi:CheY-like chemotaxis protein